ncbi:DnaJ-domain-containing protein [Cryphonectria parasitica EP155]|uniref:DnaJ-domain-containing protein n=1 Tax=Cryphonectria parasitica (strain ATCC 38755 / EP155) TaxID=660469 RepID=A0A9P4XWJ5_CRYP1|nr:DnaJ-domain-containing protein [Cryphonectria parasitica EP155]KAF3762622.1 DnaJ-domain-containing protein [Cryphonectria parasitica EP155]
MASGPPPNYYAILEIQETATTQQVRDAYKRAALKTHPDRVAADSPERPERTRKFQLVNDAYFTLSDTSRRREYDSQRKFYGSSSTSQAGAGGDPFAEAGAGADGAGANQSAFSWAWNFFQQQQQQQGKAGSQQQQQQTRQDAEEQQFGDVFEEMLREQGMADSNGAANGRFWGMLGGASGGALGFIIANVPGLLAGAVAGNRLGAIRDAKGQSVYAVFQELPQGDRARLLSQLAAKVFSHAVGV